MPSDLGQAYAAQVRQVCVVIVVAVVAACSRSSSPTASAPDSPSSAMPPFEAIRLQKITLPAPISDASTPTWTQDGEHLLFFSQGDSTDGHGHMYIIKEDGTGLKCLTCGLANEPTIPAIEQAGLAYALPDRKRAFVGVYNEFTILECSPSLINCLHAQILPIDVSAARASVPIGAINLGGGNSPHLAPDGEHLAFSDLRSDTTMLMVVGKLERNDTKYVLNDPRVVNPAGPSGPLDTSPIGWSNGGQLYEFKSFADGGAAATYVAEPASGNPDVMKVNLATGAVTRLTSGPDWDEDNAPSPDGRSIIIQSDRGMHRTDSLGLMPVRSFIDTPVIAAGAIYFVSSSKRRQCDLQPWLFPASGDGNASLMGQPLYPYTGGDIHGSNNISGMNQWSPDGTKVALNLMSYGTNLSAPYLVVAHLTQRSPTKPLPIVSSQPGSWAKSPGEYMGSLQSNQPVLVNGLASGTALISYLGVGVFAGTYSVTYLNYSDDGENFVNGNDSIVAGLVGSAALVGTLTYNSHLTLTGAHTGSRDANLLFTLPKTASDTTVTGSATSTYDGTTITGLPMVPMDCPDALPKLQPLAFTTKISGNFVTVNVTSTLHGAGANEAQEDTRPVWGAKVTMNGASATTDRNGNVRLPLPGNTRNIPMAISAGDTMAPINVTINLR